MNIEGNEKDTKGCNQNGMMEQNWTDSEKE